MSKKEAILARITPDGLGYLLDKSSEQIVHFTFDKIPNYRGQALTEIAASRGDDVTYETDAQGHVVKVFLPLTAQKKIFAW